MTTTQKRQIGILFTISLYLMAVGLALASTDAPAPTPPTPRSSSPLHPAFALLDANGEPVQRSGQPLSTMRTCGSCHDTEFIATHSFHADLGLSEFYGPEATGVHAWDLGPGAFGRWNPLTYRVLSRADAARPDLFTAEWIATLGARHVGGGPAQFSRTGVPLPESSAPEDTQIIGADGRPQAWDWAASGTVEMNCFLCHMQGPDNAARVAALEAGEFAWASTATLLSTEIVTRSADGAYVWNPDAFDEAGQVQPQAIGIQDPRSENCGLCHGVVHTNPQVPLTAASFEGAWSTLTSGQIVSPQRIRFSGLNISGKNALSRSFDIHAERVLNCVDCHYSLNNPVFFRASAALDHLSFDPRRLDFGEYLYQPLHQFAKGQSASSGSAAELDNTLRRCESCHNAIPSHARWLPYTERHLSAMTCETCHIPQVYGPALALIDWTLLHADGTPQQVYRNTEDGGAPEADTLLMGFAPVLLPRQNAAGEAALAPYNLVTAWYWVAGDPPQPVPLRDLQAALLEGDGYAPELLAALDADGDGALRGEELRLDTPEKVDFIAGRLAALGLENPRISGEVQPYGIHHGVASGQWATKDCQACHADESMLRTPMLLASYTPGGAVPVFIGGGDVIGGQFQTIDGALYYAPATDQAPMYLYLFGHDRVDWVNTLGLLAFVGVLLGVFTHGGLRVLASRRLAQRQSEPRMRRVYMYGFYERFWHWLQTAVILGLIFSGLVIHRPNLFSAFSFAWMVNVHNVLAAILVVNAALSLFYHLASGEIRQYIPRPIGFFDQAIVQAKYYLSGIFRGAPHPFEKMPERKLNPLQQLTYLAILNVLLPLQIITGALMWGKQQFPDLAQSLGGLPFLAPFHTLIAWFFAAFIVMHVYLTTTGPTPLANIQAMMLGWEEVETHGAQGAPVSAQEGNA